jgi:hypothetical protein
MAHRTLLIASIGVCALSFIVSGYSHPKKHGHGPCSNKLFTLTENGLTSTWYYDNQGRVRLIQRSDGRRIDYTYTPAVMPTTVTETISGPSRPTTTVVYNLNSQGLAISDSLGNVNEYANGYLVQQTVPSGHYIDQRVITGGNVTQESRVNDTTGATLITFTFAYNNLKSLDDGLYFLGKASKNWKQTQSVSDGMPQINFAYTLDSCRRVVTDTLTGGVNAVVTYTYY